MTIASALTNANVQAFLRLIRERESNQNEDAYTIVNGGTHFTSFADHPYAGLSTLQGGRAAGAYEFIPSTWADAVRRYGTEAEAAIGRPVDFSPPFQDFFAVCKLQDRGALDDIIAGRVEAAIEKCRKEWTSLPGADESSASWTMEKAVALYQAYGGQLTAADDQAAAPIDDRSTQARPDDAARITDQEQPVGASLLLSLLPTVLGLFAPRVQTQLKPITDLLAGQPATTPSSAPGGQDALLAFATSLFGKLMEATGKATPVQAVAAVTDPAADQAKKDAAIAAVQEHALDYLDKIAPLFDKLAELDKAQWQAAREGRDAASARAGRDRWDMTKSLVAFAGATSTTLVLSLLAAIIYQAVTGDKKIDVALVGLAGPLLAISMGVWREIFSYRFDGTPNSNAQAAITAEIQASRPK